jgi:hypothetical protein
MRGPITAKQWETKSVILNTLYFCVDTLGRNPWETDILELPDFGATFSLILPSGV